MNYEAWNRYVLVATGLFSMVFYVSLLHVGFTEFRSRISKNNSNKKRSPESDHDPQIAPPEGLGSLSGKRVGR